MFKANKFFASNIICFSVERLLSKWGTLVGDDLGRLLVNGECLWQRSRMITWMLDFDSGLALGWSVVAEGLIRCMGRGVGRGECLICPVGLPSRVVPTRPRPNLPGCYLKLRTTLWELA